MKIAICDDEREFVDYFYALIKETFSEASCTVEKFTDPEKLFKSQTVYDIIFLDIEMPKMNGIEATKHYAGTPSLIVFVTNNESFVFEAYNSTNSFGFLRKHKLKTDLNEVLLRYKKNNQRGNYFTFKTGADVMRIKYSDISYFEKYVNSVIFHTAAGDFSVRTTISEVEKQTESFGFVRTHAGFVVNLDYISLINSTEIILTTSDRIPVSRKNLKAVKEKFLSRSVSLSV